MFLFGGGDGGSSACDSPLAAVGESDISQLGFQTEDVAFTRMIEAAVVGSVQAATEVWHTNESEVHNFTHSVDQPLREADEDLAKDLCEAVNALEEELINERVDRIAIEATRIRELLRDTAEALGFARPGG